MELLNEPEIKATYEKCKYIVKLWEHNFQKAHGRLPSKLDIREADRNVRDAYKKYFKLKTKALEQSFIDVDGFHSDEEAPPENTEQEEEITIPPPPPPLDDNVWGKHLDRKPKNSEDDLKNSTKTTIKSSITKKLFCGSKFSKRNPRKSLSFTHKKSELSVDHGFLSQPVVETFEQTNLQDNKEELIIKSNVNIVESVKQSQSQSLDILNVVDNQTLAFKEVDKGWFQRVELSTGLTTEEDFTKSIQYELEQAIEKIKDYDSEDIIEESDEETNVTLHVAKKPKLEMDNKEKQNSINSSPKNTLTSKGIIQDDKEMKNSRCSVLPAIQSWMEDKTEYQESQKASKITNKKPKKTKNSGKKKATDKKTKVELRKSYRSSTRNISFAEQFDEEEDPFHSDEDPDFDPFNKKSSKFNLNFDESLTEIVKEKETVKEKRNKGKPNAKRIEKEDEEKSEENKEETYELEYSVKPRVSAPRFKNIKKLIKIQTKEHKEEKLSDIPKTTKNKLEKKIEAGTLNDNFVRIDLKKKIYARGKKQWSYSKYKKQQWKTKKKALTGPDMDMGGCDGGMLTCFHCGDIGHFARHCLKTKGDSLLPLEADKEEIDLPTLEEAAKMAKESVLAIRKPNLEANDSERKSQKDNESSDSDEDGLFNDSDNEKLLAETLKLEENAAKLDLEKYVDTSKFVPPYYPLKEDGSLIDTPEEVFEVLKNFGHSSFRPGQETAVMRILSGKSTLVTLSTGSGKSLCYQLPAYLYAKKYNCISLVISPLVSLMEDQVTGIPSFLKAACLHTNKTQTQKDKILEALASGGLSILLVSPEAIVAGEKSSGFGSLLRKLPPIAFACIDEAHCVSQWSHNFRPSYLLICRVLREKLGIKTVLGLTATATRSTSDSIIKHLQIPDGRDGIITDTPLPDNLVLTVSKDYNRDNALLALLSSEKYRNLKSIIIYCTRREECDRIASFLRTALHSDRGSNTETVNTKKRKRVNVGAESYHAGLSASRRRTIQKAFMSGELRIVVATVAFGMGINKSDIRSVIHYNMPKNFESYVQEIGRAGRDGHPAYCHLFMDSQGKDEAELRRHIHANSVDRHVIRKLLQKIFLPCSCKEICAKHEVAFSIEETVRALDIPEENISTLLCYLELHERRYIELLSPAYTVCKIISYSGDQEIKKAAKECPPLAMALALRKNVNEKEKNVLEFAVVDIAAAIGWDSGICKHKLKNLEWNLVNGQPKRSPLSVKFSNLGFRLLAPGNLTDEELDEALDSLYEHTSKQEKTAILQLKAVHEVLKENSAKTFNTCDSNLINNKLKTKIREYFESPNPLETIIIEDNKIVDEEVVLNNIRGIISMYKDNNFTGRAIARIFHGITSPNYPAVIWGRCKFWRCHLNVDFHTICRLATQEILRIRNI